MIVEGKVKSRACNIPVVDIVELSYNEVKVGIVLPFTCYSWILKQNLTKIRFFKDNGNYSFDDFLISWVFNDKY